MFFVFSFSVEKTHKPSSRRKDFDEGLCRLLIVFFPISFLYA
jgi:hypothetical protein